MTNDLNSKALLWTWQTAPQKCSVTKNEMCFWITNESSLKWEKIKQERERANCKIMWTQKARSR
jgi:hypothetical protein